MNSLAWRCPSNIALVKYWGKHGLQLPVNASLSFTLDNCYTDSRLEYVSKHTAGFDVKVLLDGKEDNKFTDKVLVFFDRVQSYLPFLDKYAFILHTHNSFPHSSGIASSASGFGALALCLCALEAQLTGKNETEDFFRKASMLARIGSGSAARSVYGGFTVWGKDKVLDGSSDEYAVPLSFQVHENFRQLKDSIMLVHKGTKAVSSSVGHELMNGHPFASQRIDQAQKNLAELLQILRDGNLDAFGKLIEKEALMLHALMMTSDPYFLLMKPNTVAIIEKVWEYRKQTDQHLFFTLDAGANVHLIYPGQEAAVIDAFIKSELSGFCENKAYICDGIGQGPQVL